jgi:hypothetical protein
MEIAKITQQQADLLAGQEYAPACHYNPVQDCTGDWIISIEEIQQTINTEYLWVKELPLSEWCGNTFPFQE